MRSRRIPGVFRFNRSAVGIQRKRVQLAECDLARGVSAVALKRVHLVQYFISSCFILYHFLAKDIRAVALLTFKRVQLVQHFIFQGWNERWTSGTNMKVKVLSMNWQAWTKFTLCSLHTNTTTNENTQTNANWHREQALVLIDLLLLVHPFPCDTTAATTWSHTNT